MDAKIYSVESVCFHIDKSNPPQLVVHAAGKVNSSGWSLGRLVPWIYVVRPADGILDFEFIAKAPSGFVLWVISPIEGLGRVTLEDWIKGVRVHTATNKLEAMLSDEACSVEGRLLVGDAFPWPW